MTQSQRPNYSTPHKVIAFFDIFDTTQNLEHSNTSRGITNKN